MRPTKNMKRRYEKRNEFYKQNGSLKLRTILKKRTLLSSQIKYKEMKRILRVVQNGLRIPNRSRKR